MRTLAKFEYDMIRDRPKISHMEKERDFSEKQIERKSDYCNLIEAEIETVKI